MQFLMELIVHWNIAWGRKMPRPQWYSIDRSMLLFGNIRYINRNYTHIGPGSGGRPLMPPSNRAAGKAAAVARRRGRRRPSRTRCWWRHEGDVELGLQVPYGSPSPLDGKLLCTVGVLVPQLPCLVALKELEWLRWRFTDANLLVKIDNLLPVLLFFVVPLAR